MKELELEREGLRQQVRDRDLSLRELQTKLAMSDLTAEKLGRDVARELHERIRQ